MSNGQDDRITTIAADLKRERLRRKFSQKQLARKLGVSKTTISAWERDVRFPKEQHLPLIADLLDLSEIHLLLVSKNRKMAG
ncbi:helix-turn-helix domain-containing protein [Paenibacillus oralis]|uniref:helix-turn-helix domain-containing protein n=1 Tax=Paenibacillus oralis TaxID=2490856 RepID=UPI0015ADAA52|nr:helix-turn-helix transcriptional regulator [Paenibacillus oralis]